jgi:hypothetical protein
MSSFWNPQAVTRYAKGPIKQQQEARNRMLGVGGSIEIRH